MLVAFVKGLLGKGRVQLRHMRKVVVLDVLQLETLRHVRHFRKLELLLLDLQLQHVVLLVKGAPRVVVIHEPHRLETYLLTITILSNSCV